MAPVYTGLILCDQTDPCGVTESCKTRLDSNLVQSNSVPPSCIGCRGSICRGRFNVCYASPSMESGRRDSILVCMLLLVGPTALWALFAFDHFCTQLWEPKRCAGLALPVLYRADVIHLHIGRTFQLVLACYHLTILHALQLFVLITCPLL